jgi:hypothetical protein
MLIIAVILICGGCTKQSSVSDSETVVETGKKSDSDTGTAVDSNTAVDNNTGTKVDSDLNMEGDTDMNNDNQLNKNVPLSGPYGTLTFIGRASVRIDLDSGMVIYIDPAEGASSEYVTPADLVLVTHQHGDHNQVGLVTLKSEGVIIQCPEDISAGETRIVAGLEIIAVSAYNSNHPAESGCGYVINYGGLTIYHSGDTSTIDEMANMAKYKIDYALICMDGYYNMGPSEALEVSNLIKPTYVIPIHTSRDGLYDQNIIDQFEYPSTIVLNVGQSVQLD